MFLVFSIIHFQESNQILKDIISNDVNLQKNVNRYKFWLILQESYYL